MSSSAFYKPVAKWSGRLLFDASNRLPGGAVRIELHNAPSQHSQLIGKTIELGWNLESNEELQEYVRFLTTDVEWEDEAIGSNAKGRVHPERLNGLKSVGPLESLAGARKENNIHVALLDGVVTVESENRIIITKPPVQIRGKKKCLVKFLRSGADTDSHTEYVIQHYDPSSKSFDGPEDTVRIPKFPKNARGLYTSVASNIHESPAGEIGWYLYGHADNGAQFVVEAWEPRSALVISASRLTESFSGLEASQSALVNKIWKGCRYQKGTVKTFFLDPSSTSSPEKAFQEGDRCLLIHLFGGIGGDIVNEENAVGLIPGHFAFGNATVVKDVDFTNELQFQIIHRQVYAHNNGGIISGPNLWSSYCGDLERGWFGTRPISDIVVQLKSITQQYKVKSPDGSTTTVCPLDEMIREFNEMGARYRTGDGDGSALVSTAHSCVQDANQAMFAGMAETLKRFENKESDEDQAEMAALFRDMQSFMTPLGVRKDWDETAKGLKGTEKQNAFLSLVETMRTFQTVVPRRAHDKLAEILLKHGARLWFIRTNQIGGHDPHIYPLAAAEPFSYFDNKKDPTKEEIVDSSICFCL